MRSRYQKPAERAPRPAKLAVYLSDAQQTADGARRVMAIKSLHTLSLRWRAEARAVETAARVCAGEWLPWPEESAAKATRRAIEARLQRVAARAAAIEAAIEAARQRRREYWITTLGAPPDFDRALRDFFDRAGRVIFASPDPPMAMRVFWGEAPGPGRPAGANADHYFELAVDIQKRANAGLSIEKAIAAVAEECSRPTDTIHKIYYRWHKEARAALGLQEVWRSEGLRPSPDRPPKIEGQEITPEQFVEYSLVAAAECPCGMTVEDNIELWSLVRRASFL
jgi:hypothetical protein